jgi:hypothetical protein
MDRWTSCAYQPTAGADPDGDAGDGGRKKWFGGNNNNNSWRNTEDANAERERRRDEFARKRRMEEAALAAEEAKAAAMAKRAMSAVEKSEARRLSALKKKQAKDHKAGRVRVSTPTTPAKLNGDLSTLWRAPIERKQSTAIPRASPPPPAAAAAAGVRTVTDFGEFFQQNHIEYPPPLETETGQILLPVDVIPQADGSLSMRSFDGKMQMIVPDSKALVSPLASPTPPKPTSHMPTNDGDHVAARLENWKWRLRHDRDPVTRRDQALVLDAAASRWYLPHGPARDSISVDEWLEVVQRIQTQHKCGRTLACDRAQVRATAARIRADYTLLSALPDTANADLHDELTLAHFLYGLVDRKRPWSAACARRHRCVLHVPVFQLVPRAIQAFFGVSQPDVQLVLYKRHQAWCQTLLTRCLDRFDLARLSSTSQAMWNRIQPPAPTAPTIAHVLPHGIALTLPREIERMAINSERRLWLAATRPEYHPPAPHLTVYFDAHMIRMFRSKRPVRCIELSTVDWTEVWRTYAALRLPDIAVDPESVLDQLALQHPTVTHALCVDDPVHKARLIVSAAVCANTLHPYLVVARTGLGRVKPAMAMSLRLRPFLFCFDVLRGIVWQYGDRDTCSSAVSVCHLRALCNLSASDTLPALATRPSSSDIAAYIASVRHSLSTPTLQLPSSSTTTIARSDPYREPTDTWQTAWLC